MGKVIQFKTKDIYTHTNRSLLITNLKERKNTLFLMIGIPCSGKTTYCNKNFNKPNTIIVSSDEIRKNIFGSYEYYEKTNDLIFENAKNEIQKFLIQGYDVVFDSTNTNSKNRKTYFKMVKEMNCKINAVVFLTPFQTCINRNLSRPKERQVPIETILKMAKFNVQKIETEGFDEIKYIKQ